MQEAMIATIIFMANKEINQLPKSGYQINAKFKKGIYERRIISFFSDKLYIELSIAGTLFLIALALDMLMDFIIYMLYFIIFRNSKSSCKLYKRTKE